MLTRLDQFHGVLLGTAVGDAIGLPREGLSARRAARMFGGPPLRHRLLFGRGMVSDDTEHACMTAQALLRSRGEPVAFARSMAWRLRWWLLALPAGVGLATARAVLRLWVGFSASRSGVQSEGNGPSMRAAILGVWCADKPVTVLAQLVAASSRLTHDSPVAVQGALAIAVAARRGCLVVPGDDLGAAFAADVMPELTDQRIREVVSAAIGAAAGGGPGGISEAIGLRDAVTGWTLHTVPAALYCWLRHPRDLRLAVEEVVMLGGDTDSTAAIVGGLVGATAGPAAVPQEWADGLWEWPRSRHWLGVLAERCARASAATVHEPPVRPVPLCWPLLPVRNLLFLIVVLTHGFRRLLPPY